MLPVSRKALLEHRYELKQMLDIVKEIEAMNRADVSAMAVQMQEMEKRMFNFKDTKQKRDVAIQ